jgi:hypothetical protein
MQLRDDDGVDERRTAGNGVGADADGRLYVRDQTVGPNSNRFGHFC